MGRKIVASRTFTYDVDEAIRGIREMNDDPNMEVSDEEVWEMVRTWAYEDMNSVANDMVLTEVEQ